MGKGFFISKAVVIICVVVAIGAAATIIALSVVYAQEKSKTLEPPVTTADPGTTTQTTTPSTPKQPWQLYRLPDSLSPVSYNVTLRPWLTPNADGLYIFSGRSTVVFMCVKETDLILIHSNKLNFTMSGGHHAELRGVDGASAPSLKTTWLEVPTQYLVVQLSSPLQAGSTYELFTEFVGELADDLGGFYRSQYTDDGVDKVVATTQMQATDARKAFPCFDEPAMKAVFHVTLIHPHGTVALSNSMNYEPVNITTSDGLNLIQTSFEPTEIMSTYLLAFIVCDFGYIYSGAEVLIRVWARRKAIDEDQGIYALEKTGPILSFFEKYYNVPYPLPKSDQIAIPDFSAGAMENWGLITYRETALLYNPAASSNGDKERVATIISHELAHMWFGNLVTTRWWNDLWLNEGFATYVSYLGANYAEPKWNMKDLIVLNEIFDVLAVDALASSHPLSSKEEDIMKPEDISALFDSITYNKGAAVLRMLSNFITEDVFTKGLHTYLEAFKYKNTVYQDLWNHLQMAVEEAGIWLPHSVEVIMNRWILQMGYPVVTIDTKTGNISQKHFLLDPNSVVDRPSDFKYEWFVPITWIKTGVAQDQFWLLDKEATNSNMTLAAAADWLVANIDINGFYRVNYDSENWERLLAKLSTQHQAIPVINRAQIIDDAFNLARANMINTTLALRTTKFLEKEVEYIPWQTATRNLEYFFLMFDRSEVFGPMQTYMNNLVKHLFYYFKELTDNWTKIPENHLDQYNQVNALSWACSTGLQDCKDLTTMWFNEWMNNTDYNMISPNLRSTVYCSAIADGGVVEWNFAWGMYKNATIASEANKLMYAMSCTKEPWLLNRYLEYCLDPTKIRKQDATATIVYIAGNPVGQPLAWDFIRANWDLIFNNYGGGLFSFGSLIEGVTRRFSSEFEYKQLLKFKEDNSDQLGSAAASLEQALERTKANMDWVAMNKQPVLDWFNSEVPPKVQ